MPNAPLHKWTWDELTTTETRLYNAAHRVAQLPSTPQRRLLYRNLMRQANAIYNERTKRRAFPRS